MFREIHRKWLNIEHRIVDDCLKQANRGAKDYVISARRGTADAIRSLRPEETASTLGQPDNAIAFRSNLEKAEFAIKRLWAVETVLLTLGLVNRSCHKTIRYKWQVVDFVTKFKMQTWPRELMNFKDVPKSPPAKAELDHLEGELTRLEEGTIDLQRELLLTPSDSHTSERSLGLMSGSALLLSKEVSRISGVVESWQDRESQALLESQQESARLAVDRRSNYEHLLSFYTASLKIQEQAIENFRRQ
jgi:hypothetical protein